MRQNGWKSSAALFEADAPGRWGSMQARACDPPSRAARYGVTSP
jgi:hypothetical protein